MIPYSGWETQTFLSTAVQQGTKTDRTIDLSHQNATKHIKVVYLRSQKFRVLLYFNFDQLTLYPDNL